MKLIWKCTVRGVCRSQTALWMFWHRKDLTRYMGQGPLRRAIQSALQNKVADKLLEEDFDAERIIVVDAEGEKICLTVSGEESPVQEKQEEQLEKA